MTIDPQKIPIPKMHAYLLGAVTPRPIALASTVDKAGRVNLSPFSFFNCFGTNPPILIFAPSRRGRDNTTKHTHENVLEVSEVVIHIVSYSMVHQMSLSSAEYPRGVDEFIKAGFTPVPSTVVKPPRVSEAPVAFECKVMQVVPTGDQGGAGILLVCEVLLMHIQDEMLDADGRPDPFKLDVVGRLGSEWYCRVQKDSIFRVPKPLSTLGIGFDRLPDKIRRSRVLTGNDLGQLASVVELPDDTVGLDSLAGDALKDAAAKGEDAVHSLAKEFIEAGRIEEAWKILLE